MDETRDDMPKFIDPDDEIDQISRAIEETNRLAVEEINRQAALERPAEDDSEAVTEYADEESEKSDKNTDKKGKKAAVLIGVIFGVLVACGAGGYVAYRVIAPSNARADIATNFSAGEGETALVVDTQIMPEKGIDIDGRTYIPAEFAAKYMDERIYIDADRKILTCVTSDTITDISADEDVDGLVPLKEQDGQLYVSFDYIISNDNCEFIRYEDPNRIAVFHDRSKVYTIFTLEEDTKVRTGPGKKYPIILDAKLGDKLYADSSRQVENEYQPVLTADGISGYIVTDSIRMTEQNMREFSISPDSFTQLGLDDGLHLGWHNISSEGVTTIPTSVSFADSLNVLCPTWLAIDGNKGAISSVANSEYVASAHEEGKKVWSTVSDFKNKKIKLSKVLGKTKTRRKLIKNILNQAKTYSLDGINIDFEKVDEDSSAAYLEFLRELTVRCHKKGLVVSVDAYPVREYNMHYNYAELGRVVDYVIIMAYDEHYDGSDEAGSVSSISYVQDALNQASIYVPTERLTIALPFYTRLWKEKKKKGVVSISSEAMSMAEADNWLWENEVEAKWDDETSQYYAKKKDGKTTYEIWLENSKSLKKKISLIRDLGVNNVAFWALGQEESLVWETINKGLAN